MASRRLRWVLVLGALGWGVPVVGVVLPWAWVTSWLTALGAGPLPADPMLHYWLRMAAGAFGMIGALHAVAAWAPRRHAALLPVLAWLDLGEGAILLASGIVLRLAPLPFLADAIFCLAVGAALLAWRRDAAR